MKKIIKALAHLLITLIVTGVVFTLAAVYGGKEVYTQVVISAGSLAILIWSIQFVRLVYLVITFAFNKLKGIEQ